MKYAFLTITSFILFAAVSTANAEGAESYEDLIAKGDGSHADFDSVGALEWYEKAYVIQKEDPDLVVKLVDSYVNAGEDVDAVKMKYWYFTNALRYTNYLKALSPEEARAWSLCAVANSHLAGLADRTKGKIKYSREAFKNAEKALAMDPEGVDAQIVLGEYYRTVASLGFTRRLLARTLGGGLPGGKIEASERVLLATLAEAPEDVYLHYQLGLTYEAMENWQKASEMYRKIPELPIEDHRDPALRRLAAARLEKVENVPEDGE